ncbi:ParA family protein [bacterium]|nr:ParA family protein [bacterium]
MSVISFTSLKGGVGKTSLSVNVAHAFACRGCRTLLIDCDPAAHATRLFTKHDAARTNSAALAKLFLNREILTEESDEERLSLFDQLLDLDGLCENVRPSLDLIVGGSELRHLIWGVGAKAFAKLFPQLIHNLYDEYDQIIIDTPPDFNVITRNAIAAADLAVVPVDASEMAIWSLEELVENARHIQRPRWAIVRTMVNRSASRVRALGAERMTANLNLDASQELGSSEQDIATKDSFLSLLRSCEKKNKAADPALKKTIDTRPIYLLHAMIYRTEQQNQLSFLSQTAFDRKQAATLAENYLHVAREIEELITITQKLPDDLLPEIDLGFSQQLAG